MKEKFKIISRLLKADAITDDEAILLLETDKEYIYRYYGYRNYPYYDMWYNKPWVDIKNVPSYNTTGYSSVSTNISTNAPEESDMTVSDSLKKFVSELRNN